MKAAPLFSIIINNWNYARFLGAAIESCLAQDYGNLETIVVDDGSTDDSRAVIARFGGRVQTVFKANGGQASAFNAGFAASRGQYVLFLDADDSLRADAASRFAAAFEAEPASKVQARMQLIDESGAPLGIEEPAGHLAAGDWKETVLRLGPSSYPNTPTSASAWARWYLEQVLPMPEPGFRVAADAYLKDLAPLFGRVLSVQEPVVNYRLHGANTSWWGWQSDPHGRLVRDAGHFDLCCEHIARFARQLGHACDAERLRRGGWKHLVRTHIIARWERRPGIPLRWTLGAVWTPRVRLLKRPAISALVLLIYLLPVKPAQALVLRLYRERRIGYEAAVKKPAAPAGAMPHDAP